MSTVQTLAARAAAAAVAAKPTRAKRLNGAHAAATAGYSIGTMPSGKALIDATAGNRDRIVDTSLALIAANPAIYRRGGALVRITRSDAMDRADAALRTDGERLLITPCAPEWLATELVRAATFLKFDRRSRKQVACDPPTWLAPAILSDGEFTAARPLRGVSSSPVLRPDGSVCSTPGYDTATGVLLATRSALPLVPQAATKDDAMVALADLRHMFSGYRFADAYGESVALSLILTRVARHLMPTAPMHLFTSPTAGSGKTEIARAASIIADGVEPSLCAWPGDDEEMRKVISSALLCGESFIVFDNVANGRTLRSASLDKALTATVIGDRMLGTMTKISVINNATWAATGNNVAPSADMVRRVIVARIDPQSERPWSRQFEWTPSGFSREHRVLLLASALTILSARIRSGCASTAQPLASFEDWSLIVRDALTWLDMPDPVRSQDALADEDPDAEDRSELLDAIGEQFSGTLTFTADEVATAVRLPSVEGGPRRRLADAVNSRLNGRPVTALRVGYILRSVRDQVSKGRALRIAGHDRNGTTLWKLAPVQGAGDAGDCG